jgi:hypothetical protein
VYGAGKRRQQQGQVIDMKEKKEQKPSRMRIQADWAALRAEYVSGHCTMRELASKHGIKAAGVMRRAANEKWEADRKQESLRVSKEASIALGKFRTDELSKFNDDDLKIAKGIRAKAVGMLASVVTPQDIRALASAFEVAQRIGRLALGASTDNKEITGKDGAPISIQRIERIIVDPIASDA